MDVHCPCSLPGPASNKASWQLPAELLLVPTVLGATQSRIPRAERDFSKSHAVGFKLFRKRCGLGQLINSLCLGFFICKMG